MFIFIEKVKKRWILGLRMMVHDTYSNVVQTSSRLVNSFLAAN